MRWKISFPTLLASEDGTSMILIILIGAIVTSSLMLSPSFFNSVQKQMLAQDVRRQAEVETFKIRALLQYSSVCPMILNSALRVQDGKCVLKSPQSLFEAVRAKGSLNDKAPLSVDPSWGESHGQAQMDFGNPILPGSSIYKANLSLGFLLKEANSERVVRNYTLPLYVALDSASQVTYCELLQLASSDSAERLTMEDHICRLKFGATTPDILYNPVTQLCQSPGGT